MNIQSFSRRALQAIVAATVLWIAPPTLATTVTLVPTGFANGWEAFNVSVPTVVDPNALATGGFAGTLDGNPIVFFCFDLAHSFSFGPSYSYDDSVPTGFKYTELSKLFTEGFASVLSPNPIDYSAGFQLAVWEILEQTTPDDVTPSHGTFYVTDAHGNTGAVTRANTLLAGLSSSNAGYTIHWLHSLSTDPQHQDFVYGTPTPLHQEVPEPAPLLLIGAALVGLFATRRRIVTTRAA